MPDSPSHGGSEWPRRYTPSEIDLIARSLGLRQLDPRNFERLQRAVEAYQWGRLEDDKIFPSSTKKGRRERLKQIVKLCERQTPPVKRTEVLYRALDFVASQLLGPVNPRDHLTLKSAAERALMQIPTSGPDPSRARRQFVRHLACIFLRVTRKRPGRSVFPDSREGGHFDAFVKATLEPFKASQGCEKDIKIVLAAAKKRKTQN
jgi:hypothetical protein